MTRDKKVHEVYARTAGSKFIISKRLGQTPVRMDAAHEVHMAIERKDANLPDAEREQMDPMIGRADAQMRCVRS